MQWYRWRICLVMSATCAPCRKDVRPSRCNLTTTSRFRRRWPPRSRRNLPESENVTSHEDRNGESHGETEIRTHQAALQCGDHWSRGSRQDDFDCRDDESFGG